MSTANQDNNPLLNVTLFLILVIVARLQELFVFLIPFRIALVSCVLAVLVFVISPRKDKTYSLLQTVQAKYLLVIFLLCFFSVPFSVWARQSFEFTLFYLPVLAFFYFLLLYSVNNYFELRKVLWTYILGVLLLAIFTLISGSGELGERLAATYTYDPNDIAAVIVVTLPLIHFFKDKVAGIKKLFLLGTFVTLLFALISTGSRGGFMGLLAVVVLLLFKDSYRGWAVKFVAICIFLILFIQFAPASYWERMATITSVQDYNLTEQGGRMILWKEGIKLMLQNPVTGVGVGTIATGLGISGAGWKTTHNSFIQIGAELGVAGFIIFFLLILSSIFWLRRYQFKYRSSEGEAGEYTWLATGLEISLWGFCVVGSFLSWAYSPVLIFLIALCGVIKKLEYIKYTIETSAL